MKLPNGERADLGSKIEDYVLNPSHWEGRHKARVFESMLGITLSDHPKPANEGHLKTGQR
jgi:hypothetical protein